MSIAATVTAMAAAGCSAEQIAAVVRAHEAEQERISAEKREKRRDGNAERQRRLRDRRNAHNGVTERDSALQAVTERDTLPKVPPKDNISNPSPNPSQSSLRSDSACVEREFCDQFWPAWPNKVGKPDALKAFVRARRKTGLLEILAGVRAYIAAKPADRPWLNPATFLNQERWSDAPAPVARAGPAPPQKRSVLAGALEILREKNAANSDDNRAASSSAPASFCDAPTLDLAASR